MRRLTPSKRDNASQACSMVTPACRAAISAASALARLCAPCRDHAMRPTTSPSCSTSKVEPESSPATRAIQSTSLPKRSTGVQQPRATTCASASLSPLTTSRPVDGTVRTR